MGLTLRKLAKKMYSRIEDDPNLPILTKEQIKFLVSMAFDEISLSLSEGEDFIMRGFGRFYPHIYPPRNVVDNTKTGSEKPVEYRISPRITVKFRPFSPLKEKVYLFLEAVLPSGVLDLGDTEED